jgi:hypothetical protein
LNYPYQEIIDLSDLDVQDALDTVRLVTFVACQALGPDGGLWSWQPNGTAITLGFDSEDDMYKFADMARHELALSAACREGDDAL